MGASDVISATRAATLLRTRFEKRMRNGMLILTPTAMLWFKSKLERLIARRHAQTHQSAADLSDLMLKNTANPNADCAG